MMASASFSPPLALEPARRLRQRPAPPQQQHHRQRGDEDDDAPALRMRRHDEVAQQRRGDEAEREEARQRAREGAAVAPRHELRQVGRDDRALGAGAEAGHDAQPEKDVQSLTMPLKSEATQ
jgi:hypothetical protein